ncbi:MAG: hypothetical protein H0U75_03055 [Legionella sp.]|nr:hypothetical protein [Legionella sp.]
MLILKRWKINKTIKKLRAMQANRVHNQPSDEVIKKEIQIYFELAQLYNRLNNNKKYPYVKALVMECYRGAASLDDAQAHFEIGRICLDEAKFRQVLESEEVLNSQNNSVLCKQLFQQAHEHLLAADTLSHVAAKRLRGLCFINGWGVEVDKKMGFELVVASVDQEGSWDKIPQIFADLGINKPEFYTAILQHRKNS